MAKISIKNLQKLSSPVGGEYITINAWGAQYLFMDGGFAYSSYKVTTSGKLSYVGVFDIPYGFGSSNPIVVQAGADPEIAVFGSGGVSFWDFKPGSSVTNVFESPDLTQQGSELLDAFDWHLDMSADAISWLSGDEKYFANMTNGGVSVFQYFGDGKVMHYASADHSLAPASDIEHLKIKGVDYLFAASYGDVSVVAFKVVGKDDLQVADSIRIDVPYVYYNEITTARADGKNFIVSHSASDIYVFSVNSKGVLNHVATHDFTRVSFGSEGESFNWRGHSYLLLVDERAEEDGGFAVYELFGNGELVHVKSVLWGTPGSPESFNDAPEKFEIKKVADGVVVYSGGYSTNNPENMLVQKIVLADVGYRKIGNNKDNTLLGSSKDDTLIAKNGDDTLKGGAGKDDLKGNGGEDVLFGGKGNDRLNGGSKSDTFVFLNGDGRDRIVDFKDDVDTIRLDSNLWKGSLTGSQVISRFAEVKSGKVIFDFGDDKLIVSGFSDLSEMRNDLEIV